jgi:hypothetical protein
MLEPRLYKVFFVPCKLSLKRGSLEEVNTLVQGGVITKFISKIVEAWQSGF